MSYTNKTFCKLRKYILDMSFQNNAGHIPSALSMVDYLYVLFKEEYVKLGLDKVIIGKPYGAQAYYSIFSDMGIISKDDLKLFGKEGSYLSYGITAKFKNITYAEDTLSSCLGVACGIALSLKNKKENNIVYVNISDASLQAGTVWEAIMFASSRKLDNILLTVDFNKQQVLCETFGMDNIDEKFKSFGWDVLHTNGHSYEDIKKAYETYKNSERLKPFVIIFDTVKGKGVSFMENNRSWHYRPLNEIEYNLSCKENED